MRGNAGTSARNNDTTAIPAAGTSADTSHSYEVLLVVSIIRVRRVRRARHVVDHARVSFLLGHELVATVSTDAAGETSVRHAAVGTPAESVLLLASAKAEENDAADEGEADETAGYGDSDDGTNGETFLVAVGAGGRCGGADFAAGVGRGG